MSESSAAGSGPTEFPDVKGPKKLVGSPNPADNGQATPPAAAASSPSSPDGSEGEHPPVKTARTLIVVLAVLAMVLFWWVGSWLDIPQHRGYEASLLQQPGAGKVLAIVVAALLFFGCTIAAHFIAGRRWLYAGPFVAMVGLAAWSLRGGPSRYVYFHAADAGQGRSVFLLLAAELALLSAVVGVIWYAMTTAARAAYALENPEPAPAAEAKLREAKPGFANRLPGILFQVLLTAIVVTIFARVDAKKEVLAAVFLGCFVGTSLTEHWFGKEDLEAWYWLGPALVGVLGYVLNYFTNADTAPAVTGHLAGLFAALSRPVPLDYASAGMVGALLGFWTGGEHPELAMAVITFQPEMLIHAGSRARRPAQAAPVKRVVDER